MVLIVIHSCIFYCKSDVIQPVAARFLINKLSISEYRCSVERRTRALSVKNVRSKKVQKNDTI